MTDESPARAAWTAAIELLRAQGRLSDSQIAFLHLARPLATMDSVFMIGVGSDFVKDWINENVADIMQKTLSEILGRAVQLTISVDTSLSEQPISQSSATQPQWISPSSTGESSSTPQSNTPETSSTAHIFSSFSSKEQFSDEPRYNGEAIDPFSSQSVVSSSVADSANVHESQTDRSSYSAYSEYSSDEHSEETPSYPYSHPTSVESLQQSVTHSREHHHKESTTETYSTEASQKPEFHRTTNTLNPPPRVESNKSQSDAHLNPRFTFENFVIGESNRFAHATALAVAEAPGSTYNPLFLYSDSGMGKTHLLHAIGNYYLNLFPGSKVLYVSSEEFTNMFINAMMNNEGHNFKNRFRSVDILLIDDIQFLSNKEGTLEEFFNTFNALATANKQIVITSDVAPRLLDGFEDRMVSRFSSGIVANIDLPNLETRIAILEKKAAAEKFDVPRDVLEFIASRITTNVREMEGSLRRVAAFAGLFHQPVTLSVAENALKDIISDSSSITVSAALIMAQTASYFNVTIDDLKSPARTRTLTQPRHIAMYLCREMTDLSLPKIAEVFDRRDHTTVLNAIRKIDGVMAEKQTIFNQVTELMARIKQSAKKQSQLGEN
ncbi:chromosomal replication initiator protein DnaA [Trueperella sp. LYQ141]|uniref:chromosomal replication initiator protein DnaA n=1 Tax=Trueperella sp. LYQ141 TaxID=3391058 RepID=UPI003983B7FA